MHHVYFHFDHSWCYSFVAHTCTCNAEAARHFHFLNPFHFYPASVWLVFKCLRSQPLWLFFSFLNKMWLFSKIRNSIPPTTTLDNFNKKLREATGKCFVDTAFWGGVIPGNEVESSASGWILTELHVNKHHLLTAGNPTHDPGWSSWL